MDEEIVNPPAHSLDEVDRFIVESLQKDGRVSFARIAEQLHVSPGMIRLRYNRLEQKGYLRVIAITNPLHLGYKTLALIGIKVDGSRLLEVAKKIKKLDEVIYLVVASGRYDLFAEVMCRDHEEFISVLAKKISAIEGVRETESFMYLKIVKEEYF